VAWKKSAFSTECAPHSSQGQGQGQCAGTYDECVAEARRLCDADEACEGFQVPLTSSKAAQIPGAGCASVSLGYATLTCTDTVDDPNFSHYRKPFWTKCCASSTGEIYECPYDSSRIVRC